MSRFVRIAHWLALSLAALSAPAAGLSQQDFGHQLDEVFKAWDRTDAPGGAVFVSVKGQIVYKKAFGMANLETGTPIGTETVFDVGSVSKMFTATCVMLLQEEGKFKIDDDAAKYLPEYPVLRDNKITIRQLMGHTAGLRDYMVLMMFKTSRLAFSEVEAEHVIEGQRTLDFAPGTSWGYSNTGFYLLKKLVEKESGKSLAEFAKERVFQPLGMSHTQFIDDPTKLINGRAFGYLKVGGEYRAGIALVAADGPGGLWTTLDDMHKWTENWKHNRLGKGNPDLFATMQAKTSLTTGRDVPYGLAFFNDDLKGVHRIQHGGDIIGFHAQLSWFPGQDIVVWTMSNDGTQNAKAFNDAAAIVVLGDEVKQVEGAQKELALSESELKEYDGQYDLIGRKVDVTHSGTQMKVQVTGQPSIEVYASEKDKFFYKVVEARIEFHRGEDGKVESLTIFQSGQEIKCPRSKPYDMPGERLDALVGFYHSEELDLTLSVKRKDDGPYVYSASLLDDVKMVPITENKMTASTFTVDIEWEGDLVKALRVTMPRASNMRFARLSAPPE